MTGVDLGGAQRRIGALPWVGSVSISRHWPGTVRVTVVEREAVAYVAVPDGRWALADGAGRILETALEPPAGLPRLVGPPVAGNPGASVPADDRSLVAVAHAMTLDLRNAVAAVGRDSRGVTLTLASCGVVVVGDSTDVDAKLLAVRTVLGQIAADGSGSKIAVLDVRVPGAPVLTRDPNCANVSTATGG
jgi:cell division protein FtsQ